MFATSIRDYDDLLKSKPHFSTPYVYKTDNGQKISFQIWDWKGDNYEFVQYIIDDETELNIKKFYCEYRAVRRAKLTEHLLS